MGPLVGSHMGSFVPRHIDWSRLKALLAYGGAPFFFIWSPNPRFLHGSFPVGDMDRPLSSWGYGLAPFRLGIRTGPFLVGDMDWPLSGRGYMDWLLSSWGYPPVETGTFISGTNWVFGGGLASKRCPCLQIS